MHNGLGSLQWYQSLDSCQPVGISTCIQSLEEMDEISLEITYLEIIYSGLSKETRAQITFPQYLALRNPSWSEEDVLHGIVIEDKKRTTTTTRWMEE